MEVKCIVDIFECVFEDDGNLVIIYEVFLDGSVWVVEILLFGMDLEEVVDIVWDRVGVDVFVVLLEVEELLDINWVEKSLEGLKFVWVGWFLVYGGYDWDKVLGGVIGLEIEVVLVFGIGYYGIIVGCLEEIDCLLFL